MIKFLKNFRRHFWQKKIIFFSLLLILLFLSLPLSASAQIWDRMLGALTALPTLLIVDVVTFLILLTWGLALVMGAILNWVISPVFITLSYTQPCPGPANCNPVIGLGLDITQHFVNLLLVVILVYIALAIALRIGEHDAKKLFARLIIVALLVNFAPVLVGLIVDASNIIMYYFLEPVRESVGSFFNQIAPLRESVTNYFRTYRSAGGGLGENLGLLGMVFTLLAMNLTIIITFFLFAGLFLLRYVAIWVIVILAPLAFVAWILPGTKRFWDMWWNNLIQWSIIGIPLAFFLYLGMSTYSALTVHLRGQLEAPEIEFVWIGILNQIFPFFVVLAFLWIGFLVGLATSAMGASAVITGTKKAGKWAGTTGAGLARRIPAVSRAEEKIRKRLETIPGITHLVGGRGAFEREKMTDLKTNAERLDKRFADTSEGNKGLHALATMPAPTLFHLHQRAAAIQTLAQRKELGKEVPLSPEQARVLIPDAQRYGVAPKTIYKARPDLAPYITKIDIDPKTGKPGPMPMTIEEVMGKIEPAEFPKLVQKQGLDNPEVVFHVLQDERKVEQMGRHARPDRKRIIIKHLTTVPGIERFAKTKEQENTFYKNLEKIIDEPKWQIPKLPKK